MADVVRCDKCRFWAQDTHERDRGECRRYAPESSAGAIFRKVPEDCWCGDFDKGKPGSVGTETKYSSGRLEEAGGEYREALNRMLEAAGTAATARAAYLQEERVLNGRGE